MLDRIFLNLANVIALIGAVLSLVFLASAVTTAAAGGLPFADLAFATTISIVTYCLAGTLHRIVATPSGPRD